MKDKISIIIEGLHQTKIEENKWKTIAGVRVEVGADGKILDEKAKKKIESRLGTKIDEDE